MVDNILLQITNTTDILKIQTKAHCYLFLRNLLGKATLQTKKMLITEVLAKGVPPLCKGKVITLNETGNPFRPNEDKQQSSKRLSLCCNQPLVTKRNFAEPEFFLK